MVTFAAFMLHQSLWICECIKTIRRVLCMSKLMMDFCLSRSINFTVIIFLLGYNCWSQIRTYTSHELNFLGQQRNPFFQKWAVSHSWISDISCRCLSDSAAWCLIVHYHTLHQLPRRSWVNEIWYVTVSTPLWKAKYNWSPNFDTHELQQAQLARRGFICSVRIIIFL